MRPLLNYPKIYDDLFIYLFMSITDPRHFLEIFETHICSVLFFYSPKSIESRSINRKKFLVILQKNKKKILGTKPRAVHGRMEDMSYVMMRGASINNVDIILRIFYPYSRLRHKLIKYR